MAEYNLTIRWILFNSLVTFILAYLIYNFNALNYLIHVDETYITLGIVLVYQVTALLLGYFAIRSDKDIIFYVERDMNKFWVISEFLMGLGLIGTVIGMAIIFSGFASTDISNTKMIIMNMASGISTVQYTTLAGIVTCWLIRLQLTFIFNNR